MISPIKWVSCSVYVAQAQSLYKQGPRLAHLYKRVKGNGLASKKFAKPIWAKPTNHHLHIYTVQSRWIQPKKVYKKKIYVGAFFGGAAAC